MIFLFWSLDYRAILSRDNARSSIGSRSSNTRVTPYNDPNHRAMPAYRITEEKTLEMYCEYVHKEVDLDNANHRRLEEWFKLNSNFLIFLS